jgi:hypothetical protein
MLVEGEHAWIVRRSGTRGPEKIEQNVLSFPLLAHVPANARLIDELKKALEMEQGMRDQLVQADKLAALGKMASVIDMRSIIPSRPSRTRFTYWRISSYRAVRP